MNISLVQRDADSTCQAHCVRRGRDIMVLVSSFLPDSSFPL